MSTEIKEPVLKPGTRKQRDFLDTTWWDPYVENITDTDTYLRRASTALAVKVYTDLKDTKHS